MIYGQDIPVGTWRLHISYNNIHSVAVTPDKIYGAAENGIMVLNVSDNSISTITKMDGLSNKNITQVAFDQPRDQLLVTYADGDIDIIKQNEIINFNTLKNSPTISGSKRINHITLFNGLAYLSTDFGVVVFDLAQLVIKETWRDIGTGGSELEINQSTIYNDSIFLATEAGILAGDLEDNLLDYNNWKRFNSGAFSGDIQSITGFNVSVYAAINGSGIYQYTNGAWQLQPYLQGFNYKNITAGGSLLVTTGTELYSISAADVVTPITSDNIVNPTIAFADLNGKYWIGDAKAGLVSDKTGSFENYTANGPTFSGGLRILYNEKAKGMIAVSGGFNGSLSPLGNVAGVNFFKTGIWSEHESLLNHDLTDAEVVGNALFISSHGYGLEKIEGSSFTVYDNGNSPLQNVSPGNNIRVTAIEGSTAGLWVANAGASQPLHLLKIDNTWESFSFPAGASRYPVDLTIDYLGNVWMILNPANGGGILVFNKGTGQSAYLTDAVNSGALPSKLVYSIAMDRDGFVWVGTEKGAAYFPDPSRVFSGSVNAVKPVFGNRFLLRDDHVTAIEVDGGNRKWMGTENGLWLFNEFGEAQVYNFNEANSPLLSNKIVYLEIDDQTGELFVITDAGIASFRSDATAGEATFSKIKIFPNPVTNQFNGQVGISGLVTDAIVKITDVSGKLVWQSKANGGSAAWNVRDYNGRRAATGMYLVFCIAQDGTESMVGKIAVVN